MLDKLEELAKAATPGPWTADKYGGCVESRNDWVCQMWGKTEEDFPNAKPNAQYIAACDPSTILRLVRVARAAKVILAHLDEGARPDQIALDELRAALEETT
jgi:hypothetical protein